MDQGGVCPRCGTVKQPWATWCGGCGYVFDQDPATPPGSPAPAPWAPPPQAPWTPPPAPPQAPWARPPQAPWAPPPQAPWPSPAWPSPASVGGYGAVTGRAAGSRGTGLALTVSALAAGFIAISVAAGLFMITSYTLPATPAAPTTVNGVTTFGDGTYVVGVDIPAGTYRAPDADWNCSWSRLSSVNGTTTTVAATNLPTGGPDVVTIEPADQAFETTGCGTWTSDLSRISSSMTVISEGTFIVGVDLEPGRYDSPGGQYCGFERMSGFGGSIGELLEAGVPVGPATVTILPTDKGFRTSGCGGWTKR